MPIKKIQGDGGGDDPKRQKAKDEAYQRKYQQPAVRRYTTKLGTEPSKEYVPERKYTDDPTYRETSKPSEQAKKAGKATTPHGVRVEEGWQKAVKNKQTSYMIDDKEFHSGKWVEKPGTPEEYREVRSKETVNPDVTPPDPIYKKNIKEKGVSWNKMRGSVVEAAAAKVLGKPVRKNQDGGYAIGKFIKNKGKRPTMEGSGDGIQAGTSNGKFKKISKLK